MKSYTVPIRITNSGFAHVKAESLEEAIEAFENSNWDEVTNEEFEDFSVDIDQIEED